MRIAIFGATSQIAKDLILSFSVHGGHELALFARRPEVVTQWLLTVGLSGRYPVADFGGFGADGHCFDAIVNFVGVGNPSAALAMGASIFDVTLKYDEMALSYLRDHPDCRYVFLSSGAAYGSTFDEPVGVDSKALVSINDLQPQDWYAVAKLHAECRHRSLPRQPIVDIRLFNYFSHTQDITARFFITDILRAVRSGTTLLTSSDCIVRDYIGPDDFFQLVSLILAASATNDVVDCYSRCPVDKMTLLTAIKERYPLVYQVIAAPSGLNATGVKWNYFSRNRAAERFGYAPQRTSLETVLQELDAFSRIWPLTGGGPKDLLDFQ